MKRGEVTGAILRAARLLQYELDPEQAAGLAEHFDLLQRWNQVVNLTAARDPKMAAGLYAEPIQILDLLPADTGGTIVDVGSGGGFPGVVLALLCPAWRILMVERSARKAAFLAEAVRRLHLDNAEILERDLRSAADLPADWTFDALTLKAVRAFGLALELLDRKGNSGSHAILFTGHEGLKEVDRHLAAHQRSLQLLEIRSIAGRQRSFAAVIRKARP